MPKMRVQVECLKKKNVRLPAVLNIESRDYFRESGDKLVVCKFFSN